MFPAGTWRYDDQMLMFSFQSAWAAHRGAGDYERIGKKMKGFGKKRPHSGKIPCRGGKVEAVKGDSSQTYKCKDIVSVVMKVSSFVRES